MNTHNHLISALIACRNEERHIEECINSLLKAAQHLKDAQLEIIVADGESTDETRNIVQRLQKLHPEIHLINNPKHIQSAAWNLGVATAKGDYCAIIGAHAAYPQNYLSDCLSASKRLKADVVGGVVRAKAGAPTLMAHTIAAALSRRFGVGSSFRTFTGGPRRADSVFGGLYTTTVLKKVGGFNEKLVRSQDFDLSQRIISTGGTIWALPNLTVNYFPKATLPAFTQHNYRDGIWAILPQKFGAPPFKLRHLAPLIFVSTLIMLTLGGLFWLPLLGLAAIIAGTYGVALTTASLHLAYKQGSPLMFIPALPVFFVRHFAYGIGSLWGLAQLFWHLIKKGIHNR
ncbi:hypothetical protein CO046_01090 [Candidatus Peregrinibacteria bacterium CG_4_9_14_0_2_um_filter_53_11]|nr:MAG: hypothetical protein CO046_01090 [Candidatus Peregrinibacteria bacterium CG_4_9_14_0_2_um_filter_53_11]